MNWWLIKAHIKIMMVWFVVKKLDKNVIIVSHSSSWDTPRFRYVSVGRENIFYTESPSLIKKIVTQDSVIGVSKSCYSISETLWENLKRMNKYDLNHCRFQSYFITTKKFLKKGGNLC